MLSRGISPVVAAVILVFAAVIAALIAMHFIFSTITTIGSRGAALQVMADAESGNESTVLTVTVSNEGPESVQIDNVTVLVGTRALNCSWYPGSPIGRTVRAGESVSFVAVCDPVPVGTKVSIVVTGTTRGSGSPVSASISVEVLP